MSKQKKINSIKSWLHRYGKRGGKTLHYTVTMENGDRLDISTSYPFSKHGEEVLTNDSVLLEMPQTKLVEILEILRSNTYTCQNTAMDAFIDKSNECERYKDALKTILRQTLKTESADTDLKAIILSSVEEAMGKNKYLICKNHIEVA